MDIGVNKSLPERAKGTRPITVVTAAKMMGRYRRLTAKAQAFSLSPEEKWVLVKYYGWRIRIFSMFPNAVSLKEVDRDHTHLPLFNIVFFSLLIILGFILRRKFKNAVEWMRGNKKAEN